MMSSPRVKNHCSTLFTLFVVHVLILTLSVDVVHSASPDNNWKKKLRFEGTLTDISTSHTNDYQNVPGVSGTDQNLSWLAGINARFERKYQDFSQLHRFESKYGRTNGDESNDQINAESLLRWRFDPDVFAFTRGQVRSEFDTFGHPTEGIASAGIGAYLLESDTYGELEIRTGPRVQREWNPSVESEGFYEFEASYIKELESGEFQSDLESFTPTDEPDDYTARWENLLTASVNSWVNIKYEFTMYYERPVGEVATKSLATVNVTYDVFGGKKK
ncbi:MAG: DUF481 domain-containing protein [bacterium]